MTTPPPADHPSTPENAPCARLARPEPESEAQDAGGLHGPSGARRANPEPLRIYVAGPYTTDPEACTAAAIAAGGAILDAGHAPFVPHLAHYWETLHGARPYEDWMRLDLAWLPVSDAVVRLPGESSGADREVALAEALGIPVFDSVADATAGRHAQRCEEHGPVGVMAAAEAGGPPECSCGASVWPHGSRCREAPDLRQALADDARDILGVPGAVAPGSRPGSSPDGESAGPCAARPCPGCEVRERSRDVIQFSLGELYPPDHTPGCLRQALAAALRTTPSTGHTHKPGQEKWDHHPAPGEHGHGYTYTCALCVRDVDALTTALLGVVQPRLDQAEAALDRVRQWIAGDPVTATSSFGDGYREALRDIRDLITPTQPDEETR